MAVQKSQKRYQSTAAGKGVKTLESTEGPYYTPGSPERTNIIGKKGTPGKKLLVEGCVYDTGGSPIPHAWMDFWQANGKGEYDNAGYNLRGHQYTDASGRYHLETVVPGEYKPRSPHLHVKVRASDSSPVMTTQIYLPAPEMNARDPIFLPALLMNVVETKDAVKATFDFVVEKK